jgi:phosphoribosyl-AMP cyclohydrolase / phosphoribosyl-ATP pyrophosphohydrolase
MQPELRAAIVQDANDGRVLMLAWMNDEALRLTRETGEAWFWSRSRERLWKKGETSGNVLAVEELRDDCDGDVLLVRVRPAGPACHTGSTSCFAPALWRTVVERVRERPEGSYVASLADAGVARAAQKLGEEAVEAAIAGRRALAPPTPPHDRGRPRDRGCRRALPPLRAAGRRRCRHRRRRG